MYCFYCGKDDHLAGKCPKFLDGVLPLNRVPDDHVLVSKSELDSLRNGSECHKCRKARESHTVYMREYRKNKLIGVAHA